MMTKFRQIATAIALTTSLTLPAAAAQIRDYDQATFDAAVAQGKPVLIDVTAWWCPVCASQRSTISHTVENNHAFDNLLILHVNYDRQRPIWKSMGVNWQATLIGFDHGHEVGRLTFVTNREMINALLATTVQP
jgi:thioredoxin-like negative regulator of GroEL